MEQSRVCEHQTMNAVSGRHKKHDVTRRLLHADVDYWRPVEPHTQLAALKVKVQTHFNQFQHVVARPPDSRTRNTVASDTLHQQ